MVSVHNEMIGVFDKGHMNALVMLDMSSAFDTVNHDILVSVIQRRFEIQGPALDKIAGFTTDRSQPVSVADEISAACAIAIGVPQGSVLGPKAVHNIHRGHC
jgi:Reverse transcriptase (RNA-dependent DNA polymerase)